MTINYCEKLLDAAKGDDAELGANPHHDVDSAEPDVVTDIFSLNKEEDTSIKPER